MKKLMLFAAAAMITMTGYGKEPEPNVQDDEVVMSTSQTLGSVKIREMLMHGGGISRLDKIAIAKSMGLDVSTPEAREKAIKKVDEVYSEALISGGNSLVKYTFKSVEIKAIATVSVSD